MFVKLGYDCVHQLTETFGDDVEQRQHTDAGVENEVADGQKIVGDASACADNTNVVDGNVASNRDQSLSNSKQTLDTSSKKLSGIGILECCSVNSKKDLRSSDRYIGVLNSLPDTSNNSESGLLDDREDVLSTTRSVLSQSQRPSRQQAEEEGWQNC